VEHFVDSLSLPDSTSELQSVIQRACADGKEVKLEKGDYAVSGLVIPKGCNLSLFSKDRVRMVFTGKRNRPMFSLEENSRLVLKEKIELYYNTNNVQEVNRLIVRRPDSAVVEISKGVKVSLFSLKQ
jgi:hypothetical protein